MVNVSINDCALIIASSPNRVCFCKAEAIFVNSLAVNPATLAVDFNTAFNCFSANSCSLVTFITAWNPANKPLAAKNPPATLAADLANPPNPLSTFPKSFDALPAPVVLISTWTFLAILFS